MATTVIIYRLCRWWYGEWVRARNCVVATG